MSGEAWQNVIKHDQKVKHSIMKNLPFSFEKSSKWPLSEAIFLSRGYPMLLNGITFWIVTVRISSCWCFWLYIYIYIRNLCTQLWRKERKKKGASHVFPSSLPNHICGLSSSFPSPFSSFLYIYIYTYKTKKKKKTLH